mgnify:FL=1
MPCHLKQVARKFVIFSELAEKANATAERMDAHVNSAEGKY